MANEKRLIEANAPLKQLSDYMEKLHCSDDYRDGLYRGMDKGVDEILRRRDSVG